MGNSQVDMARQERPMILAFTLLLVSFSSAEWSQDRMVVSFWVDPVVPVDEFPDRYAEIRQANFSVLLGGFGARTATQVSAQVEASTSAGMPSIVPISCDGCEIAAKNAWGFQIKDEPPASDFEQLANETMALRARNPDKLMFINLLPNYATPAQFGADTYGEYVSQFVATVRPQVLCTDHYPSFEPSQQQGNKTMAGYRANLEVLRDASKAAGIPFWNFFNTMPYGTMRDPTEEQLSWQVFTSLAYGAKGVLYFCYWTPTGSTFARGGAIMTPQGSSAAFVPGPHYAHARRINSVVAAWASVLFPATSDRVSLVDVSHPPSSLTTGPLADIGETPWAKSVWTESYLVGEFTLSDGTPATLIVNQLPSESLWPTITPRHNATVYEVDRSTGTVAPAVDDSPLMPGLQLLFAPGAARLLVFPA